MGFFSLLFVASMPVLQFLLIGLLGSFLASSYANILPANARRDINKVTYYVFTTSMTFASLASTVNLQELISWWYMPVNIGISFLIGGVLGKVAVKILKLEPHIEGLVVANCSAGNLGTLLLVIIPAICTEPGNPFSEASVSRANGLAYLSMSLGGIFIWTHTHSLMRKSGVLFHKTSTQSRLPETSNNSSTPSGEAEFIYIPIEHNIEDLQIIHSIRCDVVDIAGGEETTPLLSSSELSGLKVNCQNKLMQIIQHFPKELFAPPTIAAIAGLIAGAVPWLRSLIIGGAAPLRVIQDSLTMLGNGMLPCIILILGGNLTQGLRKPTVKPSVILVIMLVRYIVLPVAGIGVVKAADELGFLPKDPLFHYVLLLQFALPPAVAIGTMAQLFEVAKEECSIIFLWTYIAASVALTIWSMIFIWILF